MPHANLVDLFQHKLYKDLEHLYSPLRNHGPLDKGNHDPLTNEHCHIHAKVLHLCERSHNIIRIAWECSETLLGKEITLTAW